MKPTAQEQPDPVPPSKPVENPADFCPACSCRLEPRSCKLICPSCDYYMSCSDFY